MVDIIVIVGDSDIERMTMHNATSSFLLLEQGRKIEALQITDHTGGGAVNAAVSAARQGLETSTLIKIGEDKNGERIISRLDQEGIAQDNIIRTDELATGTAVMVSSHDKNATIFTQRGANTLLTPEDLQSERFAGRDMVYVTNLSNRSADCFPLIVERGHAAGAFVAVNPGIRQLTSRTGALLESLSKIGLLAMNSVEAASLVPTICSLAAVPPSDEVTDPRLPRLRRLGFEFGGFTIGLIPFMTQICSMGVDTLIITDGKDGAFLANKSGIYFCPTRHVEVQGTAGAGDAFISTVSASLVEGRRTEEAMQRGAINAACVVGAIDAQSGLLNAQSLDKILREIKDEIPISKLG